MKKSAKRNARKATPAKRNSSGDGSGGIVDPKTRALRARIKIERIARSQREDSLIANSVGEIPKCKNPKRRAHAESHLQIWIETYLLSLFASGLPGQKKHWPWSRTHIDFMNAADRTIRIGGSQATATARGGFKTVGCTAAALFGLCTGLRGWLVLIAANDPKAGELIQNCKTALEKSPLLLEDYPEICIPIRALNRNAIRTKNQTYTHVDKDGKRVELSTMMEWTPTQIVLPDIIGSKSRQSIISAVSVHGSSLRGKSKTTGDLEQRRPDVLLFDDIENDEGAGSDEQIAKLIKLVDSAMEMGGPGVTMAAFYAGTVIRDGCVCDQIVSSPAWRGFRRAALPVMPLHCSATSPEVEHKDLWGEFGELLNTPGDPDKSQAMATEMYARHRAKAECLPILDQPRPCSTCDMRDTCMDADAVVDWMYRYEPKHLSAIQWAMEKFIQKPESFHSEYQQKPFTPREAGLRSTSKMISAKLSGLPQFVIPKSCVAVTCGVDVHKEILFFVVTAWEADMTGYVIDYGTWPDQKKSFFYQASPPRPLRLNYTGLGYDEDGILEAGIEAVLHFLRERNYVMQVGDRMEPRQLDKILVDGGWGAQRVWRAIRRAGLGAIANVSRGRDDGPSSVPIASIPVRRSVDQAVRLIGQDWFQEPPTKLECPVINIGVNAWWTAVHKGFAAGPGTRGGIQIYGDRRSQPSHELFASHLGESHYPEIKPTKHGQNITVWEQFPHRPEDHYGDAMIYAACAASVTGRCAFPSEDRARKETPKPVRPSLPDWSKVVTNSDADTPW